MHRRLVIFVLACALAMLVAPVGVFARPSHAPVLSTGAVITLHDTPHIFIVDENAVLHWAGDTRALQNRPVDWNTRSDVSLDELKALPRGNPYLSAGLLKAGEPIYLVKWETTDTQPTLLHIQSIADVELFGINASNYGTFVLDQAAWET